MDEELEIILRAVDEASSTFQSVTESAETMGESMSESAMQGSEGFQELEESADSVSSEIDEISESASTSLESVAESANSMGESLSESVMEGSDSFTELEESAESASTSIDNVSNAASNIDGSGMRDAATGADELEQETDEASNAVSELSGELGIINSGMLLQTAEQIKSIGSNAEGMAQDMNTAAISVGQLATQAGVAEPQMVDLITTISNATFPSEEAMMYVKSLDQIGVSTENLGASATNLDRINDAFGLGAEKTNRLGQELSVLGVDMNDVSSSFNALAYANANTVGGMENWFSFLQKYDAQFKELGFDIDQSSMIIAAATQKYGGGRAALSGLSKALEEAGNDTRALEQALGMEAGSLDHAKEKTGEYEGQLMDLANEEAEHKTILDQVGAAWDDVSMKMSSVLSPMAGIIGFIGQLGSFGMTIKGLKELGGSLKGIKQWYSELNIVQTIHNAIEGEGALASAAAALGITTEAAAADGAAVSFGGLAIAEGAALWPILAIIAAIALLVVAVYEIGKAFGWWTDVGSMLDAIWAGIQRLWSAFINHPDVQAIIGVLTDAWNALVSAVQWAWNAVLEFFNINTGGEFDIVRALIEAIGRAWEMITYPIRLVIQLFQYLWSVGQQVGSGQLDLMTAIINIWNALTSFFASILTTIGSLILQWAGQIWNYAVTAATNFVNGIINRVKQLPGKFLTWLTKTYSNVVNQFNRMVTTAKNKALALVNGAINHIKSLPGKAYSQLILVVGKISSAGAQWVSKVKEKAKAVVDGAYNTLSSLPGRVWSAVKGVTDKIVKPFKDAYDKAKEIWDDITSLGGLTGGAAGFDYEGMLEELSQQNGFNVVNGEINENIDVNVKQELEILLDLKNVPSGMDESTLLSALQEMITDKSVIDALVNSSYFQTLDQKVKDKILARYNRSKGL